MKKILTFTAALAAASMAALSANAAPVDFANYADNGPLFEHGIDSGDMVTIDGALITFNSNAHPYFDGSTSNGPAGLGVCQLLDDDDQCDITSDDSIDGDVSPAEWVELVFAVPYDLLGMSFTDGDHLDLNNDFVSQLFVSITHSGGVFSGVTTFGTLVDLAAAGTWSGVTSIVLGYAADGQFATEFYLNSISDVPIPGALPLLLSGLAGLGFASRRRKTA